MKTLIFIHGGKVLDNAPTAHFLLRLQAAVKYYDQRQDGEEILFLVSGRWTSVTESFPETEAEVGKRWLLDYVRDAHVIKEDISVELIGNFAFSKPLIRALAPDRVIIPTSTVLKQRITVIADRIFAEDIPYALDYITDDLSDNVLMLERETLATDLFAALFDGIKRGDDAAFRDRLLYKTPYYFKSIVDDKTFFDTYWRGGFEHYLNGRASYAPKWRPDAR